MNESAPPPQVAARDEPALPFFKRLRYYLEAAGFFTVIGFFKLFGLDRASAVGGWIGRTLVAPTPMSRLAIENLTAAYPDKSPSEIKAVVRAMWDNLGRVMGEYAHLDRVHINGADPRIELIGKEHIDAASARGKGILLVSGHL